MSSSDEFKFDCPACGQHMLAVKEWVGRHIDCPSCKTSILIPKPPVEPSEAEPAIPKPTPPAAPATKQAPATSESESGESKEAKPAASPAVLEKKAEPAQLRIAALTPSIKLEMVRGVRRRISDETSWMPGKLDGTNAYAARVVDGKDELVDFKSPEATRFSLIGAFLLELHLKQVVRTAIGRTRLLDQEIPEAINDMLLNEMSEEERENFDDGKPVPRPPLLSHAQCLATLVVLEERYSQRMERAHAEKARRKLGTTRLGDVVKLLEKKAPVPPEEIATAFYHEVMDLRRRLERLESRFDVEKKVS